MDKTLKEIMHERTAYTFENKQIDEHLLKEIYDLAALGPTSANTEPLRIVFVSSEAAKEKLIKVAMEGNRDKIRSAPVTAIFAYDTEFYDKMDYLYPAGEHLKKWFASSEEVALATAKRNSTLGASYFMMCARNYGIDCGPMSGFDEDTLNEIFFPDGKHKVNFICNLGYRDKKHPNNQHPRLPRLKFEDACKII